MLAQLARRAWGAWNRHPRPAQRLLNNLEELERRCLLSVSVAQAVSAITTTGSSAPIYLPVEPGLPASGNINPYTLQSSSLIKITDMRADPRFSGINGAGYSIAVLDTGIDRDHSFFGPDANNNGISDRIVYQYDFGDGDADATDVNGHGSNVASIAASSDATYTGMAPGANIIALKVFANSGAGNFGMTEAALQWVVANAATYNIVSVNMSLGDSQNWNTAQTLYGCADEIAALAAMNVIVVSAAGNSFYSFSSQQGVAYPAADPNSLAVGAVYDANIGPVGYGSGAQAYSTTADAVTPFSQRHSTITGIFAPGAAITGANQSGGTVSMHGTSQASPHIAGIAVLAQQLAMSRIGRTLTLAEFRSLLASTAVQVVDGDNENDNVTNTGLTFNRVDVLALMDAIYNLAPPNAPEIQVLDGAANVADGSATISFGSTYVGTSVSKTFTVKNIGLQALTLNNSITMPSGFTVTSGFSATTLNTGETATFTVRLDATAAATYSGAISFTNNDSNESPFNFTLTGVVNAYVQTVDNSSQTAFWTTGTWTNAATGWDGGLKFSNTPGSTANWRFTGLLTGIYRVSATWLQHANRATAVAYSVLDGSSTAASATLNQTLTPNDLTAGGTTWEDISTSVVLTGSILTVTATVPASGYVVADNIRIERLSALPATPEIVVTDGSTSLTSGASTVSFGTTTAGTTVSKTFTVRNVGGATLNLTAPISVPSGYTVTSSFGSTALTTGQSTTFTVRLDAASAASFTGNISFVTDDTDENPFTFATTGTVNAVPVTRVLDNGAAGTGATGSWYSSPAGYGSYLLYSNSAGATATWTFTGLSAGQYEVAASWLQHPNRSTAVSYALSDGGTPITTVTANQQTLPSDVISGGVGFGYLGSPVNVTSGTLTVTLTVPAGGAYAIADAVYINRLGAVVNAPEIQVLDGTTDLVDGSSSVNFGTVYVGTTVSKTFTVKNVGNQDLTLTAPITVPTGFTVTSSFGSTTLTAGQSTTFTVRFDAGSAASFSGQLSFANNDSNENPFNITISAGANTPPAPVTWTILDNSASGTSTTGSWISSPNGYGNTLLYNNTAGATARWSFTGLSAGSYRVSATWLAHANRASAITYTVADNASNVGSAVINQQSAPSQLSAQSATWDDLGGPYNITSGTLNVVVTVPAGGGYVIADAIRVERLGAVVNGPEIQLLDGSTNLTSGSSTVAFGTTTLGTVVNKTFTVKNTGNQTLTLTNPITLPTGFSLVSGFGATTLAAGATTTFTVRLTAAAAGAASGTMSFVNDDADENPFTVTLSGTTLGTITMIDNTSGSGFGSTGAWYSSPSGMNGSLLYSNTSGATATWTFTGLTASAQYKVAVTWLPHANRSSAITYTIRDGAITLGTPTLNQQNSPSGVSYLGQTYSYIGTTYTMTGTTLTVQLTVPAGGAYAIVDAVLIERIS